MEFLWIPYCIPMESLWNPGDNPCEILLQSMWNPSHGPGGQGLDMNSIWSSRAGPGNPDGGRGILAMASFFDFFDLLNSSCVGGMLTE